MDYTKLSKKELIEVFEDIQNVLENFNSRKKKYVFDNQKDLDENPLENLIGTIPFLLTNKTLFEKNQDIADFAKRLDIYIPSAEKKKREDLIGRIILAISNFDKFKIEELNMAIRSLKGTTAINHDKSNFFKDWENVIKQIKI